MNPFAKWIEDELARRGWTRSEAARRGGISAAAIDRIIYGGNPGLDFYRGIARAFDLPLETVLRYAGILPLEEEAPYETELLAFYRALPDYDRRTLLRVGQELFSTDQARRRAHGE